MGLLTDKLSECPSRISGEQGVRGTSTAELCSLNDIGWHSTMSFSIGTMKWIFLMYGVTTAENEASWR
jgi:hypothetical protein